MVAQIDGQGDEEGANQGVRGVCSNDCRGSLTILTTFSLLVSRPEIKSELTGINLSQEVSSKVWDGGTRNLRAGDFAEMLQWY